MSTGTAGTNTHQDVHAPLKLGLSSSLAKVPTAQQSVTAAPVTPTVQASATVSSVAPHANEADWTGLQWPFMAVAGFLLALLWLRRRRAIPIDDITSTIMADSQQQSAIDAAVAAARAVQEHNPPASHSQVPSSQPAIPLPKREANMADLQELGQRLHECKVANDLMTARQVLSRHIQSFTRTSPWVFLEMYQTLKYLNMPERWPALRVQFKTQFGQVAPVWGVDLVKTSLVDDPKLSDELTRLWPSTGTRLWIERWMLGTGGAIGSGPPLLDLGIYREMMWMDLYLGEIIREITQKRRAREKAASASAESMR